MCPIFIVWLRSPTALSRWLVMVMISASASGWLEPKSS